MLLRLPTAPSAARRLNPLCVSQINELVNMKDSERLNLLKEIAGTKTYDDRRKESQKIMKETDERLERITEVWCHHRVHSLPLLL